MNIEEKRNTDDKTKDHITKGTDPVESFMNSVSEDIDNITIDKLIISPSRLNSINELRDKFTTLERDFITAKLQIEEIQNDGTTPFDDSDIQDKFKQLHSQIKINNKSINEKLTGNLTQTELLKAELESVKSNSKLQEQKSSLSKQIKTLESDNQQLKNEQKSLRNEVNELRELLMTLKFENDDEDEADIQSTENIKDIQEKVNEEIKQLKTSIETLKDDLNALKEMNNTFTQDNVNTIINNGNGNKKPPPKLKTTSQEIIQNANDSLLFLCDSNGKYLRLSILFPKHEVSYERCPTLKSAIEFINIINPCQKPSIILFHTATNDVEDTATTIKDISALISTTSEKFPTSRNIFSSLLPRKDELNESVQEVNRLLHNTVLPQNVQIIDHTQIINSDKVILHDNKHLNRNGVALFERNLKCYYDEIPMSYFSKKLIHISLSKTTVTKYYIEIKIFTLQTGKNQL